MDGYSSDMRTPPVPKPSKTWIKLSVTLDLVWKAGTPNVLQRIDPNANGSILWFTNSGRSQNPKYWLNETHFYNPRRVGAKNGGKIVEEQNLPKLLVSIEEAEKKIERQLEKGRWLHDQIGSYEDLDKARRNINNWSRYNLDLLTKLFENRHIVGYINFYQDDLTVHEMQQIINSGDTLPDNATYQSVMAESISSLVGIRDRLELFVVLDTSQSTYSNNKVPENPICNLGDDVFIVHGHDEAAKLAMADFVKTFDLSPIILDEKANGEYSHKDR